MGDRDVQVVGIIVANILPVDRAAALTRRADRAELRETIRGDFVGIGRHHRFDRRTAIVLQPNKNEPLPYLDIDRREPVFRHIKRRIVTSHRHAGQPAIKVIGPGVVGADKFPCTPARALDQPHGAVAAHIGKGADRAVIAAHHNDALTEIINAVPVARPGNVRDMTDNLP